MYSFKLCEPTFGDGILPRNPAVYFIENNLINQQEVFGSGIF